MNLVASYLDRCHTYPFVFRYTISDKGFEMRGSTHKVLEIMALRLSEFNPSNFIMVVRTPEKFIFCAR